MTTAAPSHPAVLSDIAPASARELIDSGRAILIDVREPSENRAERIAGSLLVPLSRFDPAAIPSEPGKSVIFHCRTGRRSRSAAQKVLASGRSGQVANLSGGIDAWKAAGLPTIADKSAPIDVMRQTQIVIGTIVLTGLALGTLVSPWFLILSGFMGAGLIFAGSTGWCGMAMLMAKMPWNRCG